MMVQPSVQGLTDLDGIPALPHRAMGTNYLNPVSQLLHLQNAHNAIYVSGTWGNPKALALLSEKP